MLAPSPDWFIAAKGVHLCDNDEWVENYLDFVGYDVGALAGNTWKLGGTAETLGVQRGIDLTGVSTTGLDVVNGRIVRLFGRIKFSLSDSYDILRIGFLLYFSSFEID